MKKLLMTLTISVVASIMIIGALIASPDAYSDKKNSILDECKCEKPHTLKVQFNAPVDGPFKIDIFKKLDDRNDSNKLPLWTFTDVPKDHVDGDPLVISAMMLGKDRLESNTAFVVYKIVPDPDNIGEFVDELVALMEIHTSCSKPLFIGKTALDVVNPNNGYSLFVEDGLAGIPPMTSIPIANASICEDEKKKSTGSITVKKALTNDNGGTAKVEDFKITVTNESNEPFDLVQIGESSIFSIDVSAGTYKLSETVADPFVGKYTTVLIAGDTGCPSMLDEVFTIKKNKNLSCTIYNDDNFDASTGGPGGIVFTNESLQIKSDFPLIHDSCDNPNVVYFDNDGIQILPCIQIINPEGEIAIVDPALKDNLRTIVLFSVFESELDANGAAIDPQCILERILPHNDQTNNAGSQATTNLAVKLSCSSLNSQQKINVNYVMIDPGM